MTDSNSNSDMLSQELILEFTAEIRDLTDAVEPDFLEMEKSGGNVSSELINRAFRAIHSIKGSAGFAGFHALRELSHALENVLVRLREGEMFLDADKTDAMLAGMDKIRVMVNDIHASHEVPYTEELNRLSAVMKGEETEPEPENAAVKVVERSRNKSDNTRLRLKAGMGDEACLFEVAREKVSAAVSEGMYVFALRVYGLTDMEDKGRSPEAFMSSLEETGRCLAADAGHEPDRGEVYRFLFGTILELELVSQFFDIPKHQICLFDRAELIAAMSENAEQEQKCNFCTPEPDEFLPEQEECKNDRILLTQFAEPHPSSLPEKTTDTLLTSVRLSLSKSHSSLLTSAETIRVSVELIDKLMNLVGEMVLGRNQLHCAIAKFIDENPHLNPLVQNLNVVISEVQENIMQMRMQPVGNVLNKIPRIVRDLARQMSKEADLTIEGGTVELDKSVMEELSNPLTHIVRNCVDHGIELPEERIKAGKPRCGQIHIRAFHEGGQVHITVKDDGRGIDAEKVAEKAITRGFLTYNQVQRMNENEKLNLIFLPGLSTAEAVTEISGRGVGMDVVKTNIGRIGGHIEIRSIEGQGATVHIIIPLTLAIIPSLIVGVGTCQFAIPQINVQELVCVKAGDPYNKIEKVGESEVIRLRDRLLPILSLSKVLDIEPTFIHPDTGEELPDRRRRLADRRKRLPRRRPEQKNLFGHLFGQAAADTEDITERRLERFDRRRSPHSDIYIVVLKVGGYAFGLHVNYLFDNEEIVVKPLSDHIKDCKCFAGATIMGDGRVAMILDAAGIASYAQLRFGELEAEERRRKETAARLENLSPSSLPAVQRHENQSILVFNNAAEEYFALPLMGISRLDIIADPRGIERVGGQEFITWRGEGLPLIRLEKLLPVCPMPEDAKELYVIIPKTPGRSPAGILVSRILDTIDIEVSLKKDANTARGFAGSLIIGNRLIFFLDIGELLDLFEERIRTMENAKLSPETYSYLNVSKRPDQAEKAVRQFAAGAELNPECRENK